MAEGYFKHMKAVGGRGAFAAVRLEVHDSEPPSRISVADPDRVPTHYAAAAETGIRMAWEQLLREGRRPPHVEVQILEIEHTTADTCTPFVVYAACMAFCDALGLELERPITFDDERYTAIFPLGASRRC